MDKNQPKPAKTKRIRKWANPTEKPKISRVRNAQVLALAMARHSQRKIAKAAGINRETVARILSQNEFDGMVSQARSRIMTEMVESALKSLKKLLTKGDRTATLETLFGLRILSKQTALEMKRGGIDERDYADTKVQFYYKYGRWPTMEECLEFEKTIEVEPLIKESAKKAVQ